MTQSTAEAIVAKAAIVPFYSTNDFTVDRSLGYLLRRVQGSSQAALEPVFASAGLSGMQWSALALIWARRAETCAEIARDLGYDKGAMTRMMDALEQRGLVERQRGAGDRRVVQLLLTEEGAAVTERVRQQVIARWNAWLDTWEADEVGQLIKGLQRLRTTIENESPSQ